MGLINGKHYPLWSQFIDRKEEWIGGTIEDFGDGFDSSMGFKGATGIITDINLKPNGDDSAFFSVNAENWGCGFDVGHGGISGDGDPKDGWITFYGYGGHRWRIKKPQ